MTTRSLPNGTFIRVRADHPELTRAGRDGMVVHDLGEDGVGLFFGFDRHNNGQGTNCVGTELWERDELDFETVEM